MKSLIVSLVAVTCFAANAMAQSVAAVVEDPLLIADLVTWRQEVMKRADKMEEQQQQIIEKQSLTVVALNYIHAIEKEWLDYLNTCANTVNGVMDIVTIGEKLYEIPNLLVDIMEVVKDEPTGAVKEGAILLFKHLNKQSKDVLLEIPAMYRDCVNIIDNLVLNGKRSVSKDSLNLIYNVEGNEDMTYHKASLLNSYERLSLISQIKAKVNRLHWRLNMMKYELKYLTWWDVLYAFDRETVYFIWGNENAYKRVLASF